MLDLLESTIASVGDTVQRAVQIVDPSGQPIESDQKKQEQQQAVIRETFERFAREQMCKVATMVLIQATHQQTSHFRGTAPARPCAKRMSFSLAFQIRARFLVTSRQPPAWVNDPYKPIGKRARREIIRQFRDRPDSLAHRAADDIIHDAEWAGSIVDTWGRTFEEAKRAENAHRADAGRADSGAPAAAEAHRAGDVSLGDASPES